MISLNVEGSAPMRIVATMFWMVGDGTYAASSVTIFVSYKVCISRVRMCALWKGTFVYLPVESDPPSLRMWF